MEMIRFFAMPSCCCCCCWRVCFVLALLTWLGSKSYSYSLLFIVPTTVHSKTRHSHRRRQQRRPPTFPQSWTAIFQNHDHHAAAAAAAAAAETGHDLADASTTTSDVDLMDDETLLHTVKKEQLVELCASLNLSTSGTKPLLLHRLREFAAQRAKAEHDRRLARIQRVQEGSSADNPKERYEVINNNEDFIGADYFYNKEQQDEAEEEDDDEEFVVFLESPERINATTSSQEATADKQPKKKPMMMPITSATLTAPPPPLEANADGERVVTVYSTTDNNDLTGVAAAQPGQASLSSSSSNVLSSTAAAANRPWDPQSVQKKETDSQQVTMAKEEVTELVQTLLAMTGAPAFCITEDDDAYEDIMDKMPPSYVLPTTFVGFNPGSVPTDLLTSCSRALRTSRGEVLQDVMRAFEIQAIGQDGMAGDKTDRGGGHYREVSKVRAFLEGYRRAEVRRMARQTAALLLDKLVQDGVEGLDITLASMARSTDDTSDVAGELNDSLLEYLNDAIRQQEQKVNELGPASGGDVMQSWSPTLDDRIESLWDVSTEEDGQRVESLDPNDPKVQSVLREEQANADIMAANEDRSMMNIPRSAPEKLLLLLKSLRERLQAEAAFGPDEKGRNLRLLAYCLRLPSAQEREELITKDLGRSLDRLDSFIELVASSIEYGESTSYQLQPTKRPLNVVKIKGILEIAKRVRRQQASKASGYK